MLRKSLVDRNRAKGKPKSRVRASLKGRFDYEWRGLECYRNRHNYDSRMQVIRQVEDSIVQKSQQLKKKVAEAGTCKHDVHVSLQRFASRQSRMHQVRALRLAASDEEEARKVYGPLDGATWMKDFVGRHQCISSYERSTSPSATIRRLISC